ncbi:MAG: DNA-3-methyladenine glycosylase [Actinomycetota bacterium]|nr:DNA-3-methyladenine glycosylase [Actinomycetota bacterium]
MPRLSKAFYGRDALTVARELLGCLFVHDLGGTRLAVRLVETEAYRGQIDPGSHGYRGPTARTEVMYGPPAHLYVYFTYGMHWCANVVCARDGVCEAVLLRAGEPLSGIEEMRTLRGGIADDRLLTSGPARLTQAMGITREHNGARLVPPCAIWCAEDRLTDDFRNGPVLQTERIGLSAGRGDDLPWRFAIDSPFASRRPRRPRPASRG